MATTKIEWTDKTWNPVRGCRAVSPGYVRYNLWEPRKWKEPCLIFVNSMSDLFHEDIPLESIQKVLQVMRVTGRHTYQVLTALRAPQGTRSSYKMA